MGTALSIIGAFASVMGCFFMLRGLLNMARTQSITSGMQAFFLGCLLISLPTIFMTGFSVDSTSQVMVSAQDMPQAFQAPFTKLVIEKGAQIANAIWSGLVTSNAIYLILATAIGFLIWRLFHKEDPVQWFVEIIGFALISTLAVGPGSPIASAALYSAASTINAINQGVDRAFDGVDQDSENGAAERWTPKNISIAYASAELPGDAKDYVLAISRAAKPYESSQSDITSTVSSSGVLTDQALNAFAGRAWAFTRSPQYQNGYLSSYRYYTGKECRGWSFVLDPSQVGDVDKMRGWLVEANRQATGIAELPHLETDEVNSLRGAIAVIPVKPGDTLDSECTRLTALVKQVYKAEQTKRKSDGYNDIQEQAAAVVSSDQERQEYVTKNQQALDNRLAWYDNAMRVVPASRSLGDMARDAVLQNVKNEGKDILHDVEYSESAAWASLTLCSLAGTDVAQELTGDDAANLNSMTGSRTGWAAYGMNTGMFRAAMREPKADEGSSWWNPMTWIKGLVGLTSAMIATNLVLVLDLVGVFLKPFAELFMPWYTAAALMMLVAVWPIVACAMWFRWTLWLDWSKAAFWIMSWLVLMNIGLRLASSSNWLTAQWNVVTSTGTTAVSSGLEDAATAFFAASVAPLIVKLIGWGLVLKAPTYTKVVLNAGVEGLSGLAGISSVVPGPGTPIGMAKMAGMAALGAMTGGVGGAAAMKAAGGGGSGPGGGESGKTAAADGALSEAGGGSGGSDGPSGSGSGGGSSSVAPPPMAASGLKNRMISAGRQAAPWALAATAGPAGLAAYGGYRAVRGAFGGGGKGGKADASGGGGDASPATEGADVGGGSSGTGGSSPGAGSGAGPGASPMRPGARGAAAVRGALEAAPAAGEGGLASGQSSGGSQAPQRRSGAVSGSGGSSGGGGDIQGLAGGVERAMATSSSTPSQQAGFRAAQAMESAVGMSSSDPPSALSRAARAMTEAVASGDPIAMSQAQRGWSQVVQATSGYAPQEPAAQASQYSALATGNAMSGLAHRLAGNEPQAQRQLGEAHGQAMQAAALEPGEATSRLAAATRKLQEA